MTDKITQADREHAAEIFGAYENMTAREKCLQGNLDMHPTTEAFARHRIQSTAALQAKHDALQAENEALREVLAALTQVRDADLLDDLREFWDGLRDKNEEAAALFGRIETALEKKP